MTTETHTPVSVAVANRADQMNGEVVQIRRDADAYPGCAAGLVHWKRPNEHLPNGEEHITHRFYVRPDTSIAIFEAGTYGSETEAREHFASR